MIKEKNFAVAKTLLVESRQDVEDEKLKNFFENFLSFFPINETTFALFYPSETRILHFSLSNGKISDFSFE